MLQTAINLSKQWPNALTSVALGALYFFVVVTYFSGSDLSWLDHMPLVDTERRAASDIYPFLVLIGFSYLYGSVAMAVGEFWAIERFQKEGVYGRIELAAKVFDTGNGLLIAAYQEAKRYAQLFGGIGFTFLFAPLSVAAFSSIGKAFKINNPTVESEHFGNLELRIWPLLCAIVAGALISIMVFRSIRKMTSETLLAISVEADRLLSKKNGNQ